MQELRPATERGYADRGWLRSHHSFSFADYYDPAHMGFGSLRVINDDWIAAGKGFGTHGHKDMEIITYVLDGAIAHRDSMGNGSTIRPGNVQRMSAGTGVMHSEFNPSAEEPTHLLQIWIVPNRQGVRPSYEEKHFDDASKRGKLRLIASGDGRDGSATIHQDADVYAALVDGDERVTHEVRPGRKIYVHVARGSLNVNGERLDSGDALKLVDITEVRFEDGDDAEVLLFDLM
ncbi:MAG TPA: pirin family protein [Burkholderiales bacterium]|nr:pirin family protein [Burkholderiales bacterium]